MRIGVLTLSLAVACAGRTALPERSLVVFAYEPTATGGNTIDHSASCIHQA